MKLKCVIFDFDGTLFDSMYLWDTVAESYVRSRGKVPKPTVREEVRALSLLQAAEHLKKEYDLAETPEEIMAGIDRIIEHFYRDEVQPKPGVVPFLKELRAKGVDVCIATATDRYLIEAALRRCGGGFRGGVSVGAVHGVSIRFGCSAGWPRRTCRAGRRGVSSLGCVPRTRFPERRTGRAFRRCRAARRASVRRRPSWRP